MEDKQSFRYAALRALTWATIFAAVAVFWTAVGLALVAWVR
jgi:hypothetical protein